VVDSEEYVSYLAQQVATLPTKPVDEEDLFLLIFTSGSTGLPKAVRWYQGRTAGLVRTSQPSRSWAKVTSCTRHCRFSIPARSSRVGRPP